MCGTKIFTVRHLVLSQYMRLTDGETDGQTELRQQYHALHYTLHGKTEAVFSVAVPECGRCLFQDHETLRCVPQYLSFVLSGIVLNSE